MAQISAFPLPLPLLPHSDFVYRGDDNSSTDSATTVFRTGITNGDVFGGVLRCIICGRENRTTLENCHLIPKVEKNTWDNLKAKRYLPSWVKSVEHESRNAVTFCVVHHKLFENYQVFIRYVREYDRYIYINYSDDPYETKYHGKAVGLNISFKPTDVPIVTPPPWEDWLTSEQIIGPNGDISRSGGGNPTGNSFHQGPGFETAGAIDSTTASGNFLSLTLTTDDIRDIVEATHNMPSWKACQIEGLSWGGTAAQNIAKYEKAVGFTPSAAM